MERAVVERVEYIRSRLAEHFRMVDVHHVPLGSTAWAVLCGSRALSTVDRACGWADPVDAPQMPVLAEGETPVAFQYCPEIMARTTAGLQDDGDGMYGLRFYLELIEHITDVEVASWETLADPTSRRFLAEDAVYAIHPRALRFLSEVQAAALDEHLDHEAHRAS